MGFFLYINRVIQREIMCAEIEVWKDEDGGLSGLVLWSDVVLRVPFGSSVVHCLSVDL